VDRYFAAARLTNWKPTGLASFKNCFIANYFQLSDKLIHGVQDRVMEFAAM
jgi:hypothetical protein